jgi:hypothetical protein
MRDVVCPICDSRGGKVLYGPKLPAKFDERAPPSPYSAHYQINRCTNCGLTYSSPVMDALGVSRLYQDSSETNVSPGEEDNVRRTMALYYRLAASHLRARERMLDIGCDMGFMLEAAKTDGFKELHGIEPVPAATPAQLEAWHQAMKIDVERDIERARNAPWPEVSTLFDHV